MLHIERLRELQECIDEANRTGKREGGYLLHHQGTDRLIPVKHAGALKEALSGSYDYWRGPFESIEMASDIRNAIDMTQGSTSIPVVQDRRLQERIVRVAQQFGLTTSGGIRI